MKKYILSLALLVPLWANAQTNAAPQTFFDSVIGYFSTINTNLDTTFRDHKGSLWMGAQFNGGAHTGSQLGLSYDVWKSVSLESASVFADVSGLVDSQQIGVGYNITVHDTRLTVYVMGGIQFPENADNRAVCELGLRVKKALTEHTFAGMGLSARIEKHASPMLTVFTGFCF